MSKYLADCPDVSQKIANKEEGYMRIDIDNIIVEYNKCKGN